MKILVIPPFGHRKNLNGMKAIASYLNFSFNTGTEINIKDNDIIWSPATTLDSSKYPEKKFIFGPQFGIFANEKLKGIKNIHGNSVYIQSSEWAAKFWKTGYVPTKVFPFPVDTNTFRPMRPLTMKKDKVILYLKHRDPKDVALMKKFLASKNVSYEIFKYGSYGEFNYLRTLKMYKYMVVVDAHESQGFAIEEALSCDVPLLVWNVRTMCQEFKSPPNYKNKPCTNIAYWDERCGEYFYEYSELEDTFSKFINKLNTYKPREYILENLSVEKSAKRFKELISNL